MGPYKPEQTFWVVTPCSWVEEQGKQGTCMNRRNLSLASSSSLKMEPIYDSETTRYTALEPRRPHHGVALFSQGVAPGGHVLLASPCRILVRTGTRCDLGLDAKANFWSNSCRLQAAVERRRTERGTRNSDNMHSGCSNGLEDRGFGFRFPARDFSLLLRFQMWPWGPASLLYVDHLPASSAGVKTVGAVLPLPSRLFIIP
jgi:hypothetical protein